MLTWIVNGALRRASVPGPVFRPFGGHWQLEGNHCSGAVGCRMEEGGKASWRVGETDGGNQEEGRNQEGLGPWSEWEVGPGRSGSRLWRVCFSQPW